MEFDPKPRVGFSQIFIVVQKDSSLHIELYKEPLDKNTNSLFQHNHLVTKLLENVDGKAKAASV